MRNVASKSSKKHSGPSLHIINVHLLILYIREFIRDKAVETVGLKRTGKTCLTGGARGRCRYNPDDNNKECTGWTLA